MALSSGYRVRYRWSWCYPLLLLLPLSSLSLSLSLSLPGLLLSCLQGGPAPLSVAKSVFARRVTNKKRSVGWAGLGWAGLGLVRADVRCGCRTRMFLQARVCDAGSGLCPAPACCYPCLVGVCTRRSGNRPQQRGGPPAKGNEGIRACMSRSPYTAVSSRVKRYAEASVRRECAQLNVLLAQRVKLATTTG